MFAKKTLVKRGVLRGHVAQRIATCLSGAGKVGWFGTRNEVSSGGGKPASE